MSAQDSSHFKVKAVISHAEKSVMPMVAEVDNKTQICGTATLVTHKGNFFLVTADHVAKYLKKYDIAVPASPLKSELWQIGNAKSHACQFDLTLVHLRDQDLIDRICSAWMPLSLDDVRQPHLSSNGFYLIYGFPSCTSEFSDGVLHSKPISLVTGEFEGEKKGFSTEHPFNADVDHLIAYSTTAIDPRTGDDIGCIPYTKGMSGSPVWQISMNQQNDKVLWSPASTVSVVGSYTSDSKKYGWLRVRRWIVVDAVLKELNLS